MDWLLAFLYLDIASLRPGEVFDLRADEMLFCVRDGVLSLSASDHEMDVFLHALGFDDSSAGETTEDDRARLIDRQTKLRTGIDRLWANEPWDQFEGMRPPDCEIRRDAEGNLTRKYVGSGCSAFLASAGELLLKLGSELRTCRYEGCGTLFLPRDRRQRYHHQKCSQKERHERAKPNRNYHKEYVARHKKTGGVGNPRSRKARES